MAEEQKKFKVIIDGITIDVPQGTTILNAARMIGEQVTPPAMCYYSKLKDSGGKCRTCLVEVAVGSVADPRPMPKIMASSTGEINLLYQHIYPRQLIMISAVI